MRTRFKLALALGLFTVVACGAQTDAGSSQEALNGGTDDAVSPFNNAVVSVGNVRGDGSFDPGCTGTLIAPDVVITAGHCIHTSAWFPVKVTNDANHTPIPQSSPGIDVNQVCVPCPTNSNTCITCNAGNSACTAGSRCISYDITRFNGNWQPTFADRAPVDVSVGGDLNTNMRRRVVAFNSPQWVGNPFTGHADIIMLGLTGGLLDPTHEWWNSNVANPRELYNGTPAGLSSSSQLGTVGYSVDSGPTRHRAYGQGYTTTGAEQFTFGLTPSTASIIGGDSGSPVFFGGVNGNLMGVIQGNNGVGTGRATSTFYPGSGTTANISAWTTKNGHRSFCSATTSPIATAPNTGFVKLMSWWSDERLDNFTTTNGVWNGCYPGYDRISNPGYNYSYTNLDGWIARGDLAQPAGTVALDLFWNATENDNATLTPALAPGGGYVDVGRIGWIFTSSAANRVPLFAWRSASRTDFFTTTRTNDYTSAGYVRVGPATGIGFVVRADQMTQQVP